MIKFTIVVTLLFLHTSEVLLNFTKENCLVENAPFWQFYKSYFLKEQYLVINAILDKNSTEIIQLVDTAINLFRFEVPITITYGIINNRTKFPFYASRAGYIVIASHEKILNQFLRSELAIVNSRGKYAVLLLCHTSG